MPDTAGMWWLGADYRGGVVTLANDEPEGQAHALIERVFRLLGECRGAPPP